MIQNTGKVMYTDSFGLWSQYICCISDLSAEDHDRRNQERDGEGDKQDIQQFTAEAAIRIMVLNPMMISLKWKVKSTVQAPQPTPVSSILCILTNRANPSMSFIHFKVS